MPKKKRKLPIEIPLPPPQRAPNEQARLLRLIARALEAFARELRRIADGMKS